MKNYSSCTGSNYTVEAAGKRSDNFFRPGTFQRNVDADVEDVAGSGPPGEDPTSENAELIVSEGRAPRPAEP
jgi:hypothetical protein